MWLIKRELFRELLGDSFSRFFWICGILCIAGSAFLLLRIVFPAFSLELILHKEQDAVQLAQHLVHEYQLDRDAFAQKRFPPKAQQRLAAMAQDFKLYKIRLYNARGFIVYSTVAAEIGEQNTHPYFSDTISRGKIYSKLAHKDTLSLEGQRLLRDVVETYIPVMKGTAFIGAIEIYTDVTPTYQSIQRLVGYMKMSTVLLALVLACGLTLLLLAQAKQKLDAKKHQQLAADMDQIVRHDLKAPLSTLLQGFDFLAQETDASEEQRELFQDLKKVAYRMLHSINSSLTLRKIETGGYVTTKEPVDIPSLLADIQADLSQLLQRKKLAVVLRRKNTPQGFTISGDHALLYSILANLLKNALEASAREQEITITLFTQGQSQSIAIRNNGAVPAAIRTTFFDKYVSSNKPGGTGFGTYAAKLMTEIQGGQIRLECNDEAKSTTVYVSFPA